MKGHIIVDNRYKDIAERAWGGEYEIIPSVTCKELPVPTSAHPDMVLFKTGKKEFICAPNVFSEYEKLLKDYGVKLICGEKEIKCNYPDDIAYNVFKTDKFALAKFSNTDETILRYLGREKIEKTDIKQGYAKCSVCGFGGGIISSDGGICAAAQNLGLDVLEIPSGEIKLPGYDYGFIGGASGESENGEVFFFGDLSTVSYGDEILNFLKLKGIKVFQIENFPLTDVGTILFF